MFFAKKRKTNKKRARNNRLTLKAALVVFLCFAVFAIRDPFNVFSATLDDLKQAQEQKQQRLAELNQQIREQQQEINTLIKQTNTLQNQIAIFTAQINQLTAQIVATQTQIEIAGEEITALTAEIAKKEQDIEVSRIRLAEMIRTMYEYDRSSAGILALMNNSSLSDFLNAVSQIENLQGKSYELLQEIKAIKAKLEADKVALEQRRTDLQQLQVGLQEQQVILDRQIAAKNDLLRVTRGQEQRYRQLLAQTQAEEDKIEQEIQDLENQIRTKLGQRVSPGKKGLFVWPMNGYLTQRYGNTGFTSLGYNFHNGIDVAAAAGTPIVSAYDGKVVATGTGEAAYGNWVTVKHELSNGRCVITLYAHLLRISVRDGQDVAAGKIIGTEGNTGNTTRLLYGPHRGFHLHFTVFDCEGFQIVPGKYGAYQVPIGYTYDPMEFL